MHSMALCIIGVPSPLVQTVACKTWEQEIAGSTPARPIFPPGIDDLVLATGIIPLNAVRCFDNGYVGKQPEAWKEYCTEYWLKEIRENMDTCTGRRRHNWNTVGNGVIHPYSQSSKH